MPYVTYNPRSACAAVGGRVSDLPGQRLPWERPLDAPRSLFTALTHLRAELSGIFLYVRPVFFCSISPLCLAVSPPSLLWRLKYAKVIWTESDTLQWQKKENDTAICWWYGDEQGRRWKCERRKTDSNVFWMHKYALRPGYNCLSDSSCMRLVFRQTKGFALKGAC